MDKTVILDSERFQLFKSATTEYLFISAQGYEIGAIITFINEDDDPEERIKARVIDRERRLHYWNITMEPIKDEEEQLELEHLDGDPLYTSLLLQAIDSTKLLQLIALELQLQKINGTIDDELQNLFTKLLNNDLNEHILYELLAL